MSSLPMWLCGVVAGRGFTLRRHFRAKEQIEPKRRSCHGFSF